MDFIIKIEFKKCISRPNYILNNLRSKALNSSITFGMCKYKYVAKFYTIT